MPSEAEAGPKLRQMQSLFDVMPLCALIIRLHLAPRSLGDSDSVTPNGALVHAAGSGSGAHGRTPSSGHVNFADESNPVSGGAGY